MRGTTTSTFPGYGQYTTSQLLAAYRSAPDRLRRVVDGLSQAELRAHLRPGKWSVLEIAIHLADAEVVGAGRVRLAWAQPGSNFVSYDQDKWALALEYQSHDGLELEAALTLFESLRQTTRTVFDRAGPEDWIHRWGTHPEYGPITLRNLLELYADHGERHVGQILALRVLLGRPLELSLLLPERLY